MLPDRVSNPGPLTYQSGALPIALRGLAILIDDTMYSLIENFKKMSLYIKTSKLSGAIEYQFKCTSMLFSPPTTYIIKMLHICQLKPLRMVEFLKSQGKIISIKPVFKQHSSLTTQESAANIFLILQTL